MHNKEEKMEAFGRLLDILDELRVKCPWDKKQTNESLRPNTIEETYELCDALMRDDKNEICKELGDVLLHVIFYAKIGSEKGDYDSDKHASYTIEEFRIMYASDTVSASGEISLNHYSQILTGIRNSPMIDDEIKELIPNPDTL